MAAFEIRISNFEQRDFKRRHQQAMSRALNVLTMITMITETVSKNFEKSFQNSFEKNLIFYLFSIYFSYLRNQLK